MIDVQKARCLKVERLVDSVSVGLGQEFWRVREINYDSRVQAG
jgi:hypothetical protein